MPHLVILYTANLDRAEADGGSDMAGLCRRLADAMLAQRDEAGRPVFPPGGVRVLAYPAAHWAVADGGAAGLAQAAAFGHDPKLAGDYAFVYLQLRMARGRSDAVQQRVGRALQDVSDAHFASLRARRPIGVTVQVDVGPEVYDGKTSSLHPLFAPKAG